MSAGAEEGGQSAWLWPAVLVGIGLAGTLDEVLLHQLLHWHHFYTGSTRSVGLVTDGVFHAFSTVAMVAGLVALWRGHAEQVPGWRRQLAGGTLAGAGGFNLYDGVVQHKLLRLHQVREGVPDELPYDAAFIALAAAVLAAGVLVLRRAPTASAPAPRRGSGS